MATKWAGVWTIPALLALTFWWEVMARREGGLEAPSRRTFRDGWGSLAGAYLLLPGLFYLATYIGRLEGTLLALPWSEGSWWRAFVVRHLDMLEFHSGLEARHYSASPAWSWPLLQRPTLFFFRTDGVTYREILAFGSPLVWWTGILALLHVAWRGLRERGMDRPEWVILAGFVAGWVPWIILSSVRDFVFLFYFLPSVPFLAVAVGYVAHRVWRSRLARAGVATFAVASVALFGFYFPLLTASPLSPDAWQARIVFSGCEEGLLSSAGELKRGPDVPGPYPEALQNNVSPAGWCWV
jgi:hypothetical protein